MNTKKHLLRRLPPLAAFFFIILISSAALYAQQTESAAPTGVPDDWTHHHVVFSDPGSVSQAAVRGNLDEWKQITQDPRYKMQQIKRAMMQRGAPAPAFDFATLAVRLSQQQALAASFNGRDHNPGPSPDRPLAENLKKDWSMVMGGLESITGTFSGTPSTGTSLTLTGTTDTLVLDATAAASSTSCAYSGGTATVHFDNSASYLANLITLINTASCGPALGVTASNPTGTELAITATTAGTATISVKTSASSFGISAWDTAKDLAGGETPSYTASVYPAKFSFDTGTANCDSAATPDYVVYPTDLTGSASQPNIVAYDNLYKGCSTSSVQIPNVYWQYNTGGTVKTSPVLSGDGKQVAFVQTNGSSQAQLILLKWSANSALQTLNSQTTASAYNTCIAPCMFAITFDSTLLYQAGSATVPNDTYSSPFYDYNSDTIYVGEDNGYSHRFHPVFNAAPAEVIGSGWPFQTSAAPLNSPVYDYNSTNVFAGPAIGGNSSSAYFHRITTSGTAAGVANNVSLAVPTSPSDFVFIDGAVVDSTTEKVYVFVNDDDGSTPSAAVWQLPALFTSGYTPPEAKIGNASPTNPLYPGQFDNIYYNSTGPTGNLYVCGRNSSNQDPSLWRIPITLSTNAMGTPVAIDTLTTAATNCSGVTEFDNAGTDYIFLSVQASSQTASPVSCPSNSSGCLMSFTVNSALAAGALTTARVSQTGGTGGIVIDNNVSTPSGSQVYFMPLGNQACAGNADGVGAGTGPCAIQASQSGLN